MQKKMKGLGIYAGMLVLLTVLAVALFMWTPEPVETYEYSDIINLFKQEKVEEYSVDFNTGYLTLKVQGQEEKVIYELANISFFREDIETYMEKYEAEHP